MKALIDGDTIAYAPATSAEGAEGWVATSRVDNMLNSILDRISPSEYVIYVSGGHNFRKDIDPTYKAQRPPSPEHRILCHQYLIDRWGAIETDGYEADDAVGCAQKNDTVIVGIDKDLLQIPGKHYQWEIRRKGVVVKEERWLDVSPEEGMRSFFKQMLTGDVSDNIIGIKGIGPVKAAKIIEDCSTEEEMYDTVRFFYQSSLMNTNEEIEDNVERFNRNLNLLWIWRELGITYTIRREMNGTN